MNKKDEALKLALEGAANYIDALGGDSRKYRQALAEQPAPPPECQTEAEKTAFAFGWWKALEQKRKADSALDRMADNARELGLDYEPDFVLPGGGHVPAVPVAVYGYCPECGGAGVMRERRPNGDDKCTNGHKYPSAKALAEPPLQVEQPAQPPASPEELAKLGWQSIECPFCGSSGAQAFPKPTQVSQERKQQSEERVEPVAYIHRQGNHWEVSERFLCDDEKARGWTEEPLYTSPQPLPEEYTTLERALTRLQKRYADLESGVGKPTGVKPWVGLTEYDIDQIPYSCSHADSRLIAFAIEAKLKDKNAQSSKPCQWQQEDSEHMPDTWRSDCGVLWTFTDGGPIDNDMKHCCGCGAKLREKNNG